ncbi:MAG: SAM-dependent DNA methyltransferase, partial [Methylobacter sp.]
ALEARHKAYLKLLDMAEKTLRARQWPGYGGDAAREAKKSLLHRDLKKREQPTARDRVIETLKQAVYFISQGHWLLSRFPHGVYADVPGLCKAVSRAEITANDYSLTPGRYVGVALSMEDDDDGEAFRTRMMEIHSELAELNDKAAGLAISIQASFAELLE